MGTNLKATQVTTDSQILAVADLAREIWTEHFTPIIGVGQVEYMLANIQSADAIGRGIRQEGFDYFLINEGMDDVGYFAISADDNELFLSKLYIRSACRGKGLGRKALDHIERVGRDNGLETVWLTVNKYNSKVIDIYKKVGFVIESENVKDIGGGFIMDDYKMVKKLCF